MRRTMLQTCSMDVEALHAGKVPDDVVILEKLGSA